MDRRQKKTREAIFKAFSRLLEKKRYSRISIQNIIDEADVGRTTFYAHFRTKEDLLNQMCEEVFGHVFSAAREREDTHDFSSKPESLQNELTHLLFHVRERKHDIFGLLSGQSSDVFLKYFKENLAKAFDSMTELFPRSVPKAYAEAFYMSAFSEIVSIWIKNGAKESPEQISGYFFALIHFSGQQPSMP
jgi:AcrR family transcriptional regulator